MTRYYFLAASLPPLVLGEAPDITFEDLLFRLKVNLSKDDLRSVEVLRCLIDIENIRRLLMEEPLDPRGSLSEKELDDALLNKEGLSETIFEFLDKYDTLEDRLKNFAELLARFFREEIPRHSGFVAKYLEFERRFRLVMTALRCRLLGQDIYQQLQFEDFSDVLVGQILAQKDAAEYQPPQEFAELKSLLASFSRRPLELHKRVEKFRYEKIAEMGEDAFFSIDAILSYIPRLMIVENWIALDPEIGDIKLRHLLDQELEK